MLKRTRTVCGWLILAIALFRVLSMAQGTNDPSEPTMPADDGDIGLGLFSLGFILLALLIVGIGSVAAIVALGIGATLVALGIVSSSVLVGAVRRSPAAGLRALALQLGAGGGLFAGLVAGWLGQLVTNSGWSLSAWLIMGGATGVAMGGAAAWLFNVAWSAILKWIRERMHSGANRHDLPQS